MKYKLIVRAITDSDTNTLCPFAPEEDDVTIYLDSLIEDINNLSEVRIIKSDGFKIDIELMDDLSDKEIKGLMKPFFTNRMCFIRFVSLTLM